MSGVSNLTGRPLDDLAHLKQSIADILTTPIGSRVQRRDYGSMLFELVDQPFNGLTRLRMYAAVAQALARWEPRLQLRRVAIAAGDAPGDVVVQLEGVRTDLVAASAYARLTLPIRAGQGRALSAA